MSGTREEFPAGSGVLYEEGFDAKGCRMVERMWREGYEDAAVAQSLRCHSPADLRLLLETIGLSLVAIEPYEDESYGRQASLAEAMLYLCKLEKEA
jgi:hypothetical protein